MMKWLIKNRLAAFERTFGYDAGYMREVLDADLRAFLAIARLQGISRYRKDIPRDVYYAAKIAGALVADCGPCTQLVVTMALHDGVPGKAIAGVLEGRYLTPDHQLAASFARAVLARDPNADELRVQIVKRWSERALISLGMAIIASQVYPTFKYALGHGKACQRVVVEGQAIVPRLAA